ncbi:MAG: sulfur carrier protein ThiS [Acidobacteria bacterium]|nr:sulfur carrier protein ThiS [Acidobacteriota bacterium]
MEIRLNGALRKLPEGSTLLSLLESLGRDPRTVAVELNRSIVRRAHLAEHRLEDGDRVEVVHFVQGG